MMRLTNIWVLAILLFSFVGHAQNATFTVLPQDNQLFQRNVTTNSASVSVQGYLSESGFSQVRLELKNEQGLVDQIVRNIGYAGGRANFQFTTNIPAARNNHEIVISALRNGNWILVKTVPRLLAGDIYIINGQSNAQALAAPNADDVDEYTRSWFALYGWGTLNLSFPGLWGARLAKQISVSQNLPVAIFNQAVGAETIKSYLPTVNGGNYASLMQRFADANMANPKIRAAYWFHGEANAYGTSTEEYVADFTAIKQAWERDYNIDHTFIFQMRYGSCSSQTADILEAHRVIANTLSNTVGLSTTNANHDNCHFYYENGYRELGDRMAELTKNKLYGSNNNLAYSADIVSVNISNSNTRKLILEFDRNLPLKTIGGFPYQDFKLKFSNASIIGGRVNQSRVELDLDQPIQEVSGLTFTSHIGYTPGWITNQADVGIFTFHDFPIANAPTNSQTCNANYSVNGQRITVSNVIAPIVTIAVFKKSDYSQLYSCSTWGSPCSSVTDVTLAPGEYFIQIKSYRDNGNTTICDIFEEFTIGGSAPTYDCPTLSANIGDACNDFNSNTTNDVVQANCTCAGTVPPPTYDCPTLGRNIGDSCNDGDPNTTNDVILNNCSCAGTPIQTGACNVTYNISGNTITFQNVDAPISFIKVMDASFQPKFECNSWSNACTSTITYDFAQTGKYYVQVQTQNSWTSTNICNIFEEINVTGGGTNSCDNITNGGIVAGNEVLCLGENTNAFVSTSLPSGGSGTVEYRWLSSTSGCPTHSSQIIQGANQSTYAPGQVSQTTYFRRQSKRAGCTDWTQGESNCVVKYIATDCVPQSDPCDVTYQINGNQVIIQNLDFPINSVKIYNSIGYTEVFSCDNWSSVCNQREDINLPSGSYFLNIQTYEDWNNPVCTVSEMITIGSARQGNGNTSNESIEFEIEESSSSIKNDVAVFPNPAQNEINLSLENYLEKDIQILMVDQMGKQQQEISIQNNQDNLIKIPLDNVRNGIYLIWIHPAGAKPISKKILVRKDY